MNSAEVCHSTDQRKSEKQIVDEYQNADLIVDPNHIQLLDDDDNYLMNGQSLGKKGNEIGKVKSGLSLENELSPNEYIFVEPVQLQTNETVG